MFKKQEEEKDYVFCEECGVAVKKEKAQVVKKNDYYIDFYCKLATITNEKYYCQAHKKPYDVVDIDYRTDKPTYIKNNVEVNEKGKVI